MMQAFKDQALRLDPSLRCKEEPWKWPATPEGRMGLRWIVRNGAGDCVAMGDLGNAASAWRRAFVALDPR